ncbi:hypothetical protein BJX70DRAFT_3103 [Aspergillus crustosus]
MPQENKRKASSVERGDSGVNSNDQRPSKRTRQEDHQSAKEKAVEHWVVTDEWGCMPMGPHIHPESGESGYVSGRPYRYGSSTETVLSMPLLRHERDEPYQKKKCKKYLEKLGVFLGADKTGISKRSATLLEMLLAKKCKLPPFGGKFGNKVFSKTCERLADEDDETIVQILGDLIVPGMGGDVGDLDHLGFTDLMVSANETWGDAVPLDTSKDRWLPIPQPNFAVGYAERAFTQPQYTSLSAELGNKETKSLVRVSEEGMYFVFLTAEVNRDLDIAELQSSHSLAVSLRGLVRLFRLVRLEKMLDREILAFSVHYNESEVTMYGHYPMIHGDNVQFHRHLIKEFDFQADDGKERWTAYRFIMAVYSSWVPKHLKRICVAIDRLDVDDGAKNAVERIAALEEIQAIFEENPTPGMMDGLTWRQERKEAKERRTQEKAKKLKADKKSVDQKRAASKKTDKKQTTKKV